MRGKGLWQRIHCWGGTFSHKTGWLASVWTGILSELTLLNVLIDGCDPWALVRCVRMRAEVEPMEVQKSDELDEGVTWFSWFMSHVLLVHQEDDSLSLCCNFTQNTQKNDTHTQTHTYNPGPMKTNRFWWRQRWKLLLSCYSNSSAAVFLNYLMFPTENTAWLCCDVSTESNRKHKASITVYMRRFKRSLKWAFD